MLFLVCNTDEHRGEGRKAIVFHALLCLQMAPYTPNSTAIEVEKEETTSAESLAGQYMRTIQSVSSELYLDGLRQEVGLLLIAS